MSGPQCCETPPTLSPGSGAGHVEQLGGLNAYPVGSPESKLAILLVYGYEAPNLRKLADKVAAAGFYVVVPDHIKRDPYAPENTETPIGVWIKDHGAVVSKYGWCHGLDGAQKVVDELSERGICNVASLNSIRLRQGLLECAYLV